MNTYRLTVTVLAEGDHLFPTIMKVQDALAPLSTACWVDWDRDDPQSIADFEGAKQLLAPASE